MTANGSPFSSAEMRTQLLLKSEGSVDDMLMLDPMTSMLPPIFQTKLDQLDFTAGIVFSFQRLLESPQ